jgi:hypothetical protein
MEELDPAVKQLVLYHLKLDIEEKIENQVGYFKGFEKKRYDIRDSPELIALEAFCTICQVYYPIGMNLLEYLSLVWNMLCYFRNTSFEKEVRERIVVSTYFIIVNESTLFCNIGK